MLNSNSTYGALVQHTHAKPDSRGECWLPCPECGKAGKHFSFSERGAFCFHCGTKLTLAKLAARLGVDTGREYTAPPAVKVVKAPKPWQAEADILAANYYAAPGARQAWNGYKRLKPETHNAHKLGLGVLPSSPCYHPRLTVPLYRDNRVVGFRGRRIDCQCAKWISPSQSEMTLFNHEYIEPGKPVVIVENPIDALMIGERLGYAAVATLGVSIWKDWYTDLVRPASEIIIGFDNDVAGNLHTRQAIAEWQAAHAGQSPALGGLKLFNKLAAAGLKPVVYDWAGYQPGADWGDVLRD